MAASAQLLSTPATISAATESAESGTAGRHRTESVREPDPFAGVSAPDSGLYDAGTYGVEPPLTSEPPLAAAAPLTSEPPIAAEPPLTSEPTMVGAGATAGAEPLEI